jgi:hypothetical protein
MKNSIMPGMRRFEVEQWEPSEWERLLKAERIRSDSHAIKVMSGKSEKSLRLRMWIGANATRRFVPSEVLEFVGLRITIDFRFPES